MSEVATTTATAATTTTTREGIQIITDPWFTSNNRLKTLEKEMIHHLARMQYHHNQFIVCGDSYREAVDELQRVSIVNQSVQEEQEAEENNKEDE